MVYSGLGQDVGVYGTFDDTIFHRLYEMLQDHHQNGHTRTKDQIQAFWAPMMALLQQIRGDPVQTPAPPPTVIDVDAEMEEDDEDFEDTVDDLDPQSGDDTEEEL